MRIGNRVKRNIFLALTILGAITVVAQTWNLIMGNKEWWNVVSSIIITICAFFGYSDYRKRVKEGRLFD